MTGDQLPFDSSKKLTEQLDIDFALQAAELGVWEINPTTNQVLWDERCQALFGLRQADTIPLQETLQYIHSDDLDHVLAAIQRITTFPSDRLFDQTYRTVGADGGKLRWVRFWGQAKFTPTGDLYRFSGIAQEVTQQVLAQQALERQQAQQRFLLQLSDALRSLTDPLTVYYQTACLVGEYLGANRVGYAEDQGDGNTIVVLQNYVNGVPDLQGTYQYADYGPLLDEFLAGRTVARSDIANDPSLTPAQKEAHRVLHLGATLNKPLLKDGRLMAVLFIHYQQAHHWSADELSLLEGVAERLVVAVDRAMVYEALQQSEQRFRMMADLLPQAIWVTDAEGNTEFLNKWWETYTGMPFNSASVWQISADIVHPEDRSRLIAVFRQAIETGIPFDIEHRNRSASGEYRWFLNKGEPYRDPQTEQITKWVGMGIDIHDRKRAEHLLQQSEARYRLLAADLEQQVRERTLELTATNTDLLESNALLVRSNKNLEQFAYIASHDLQEPLRKIKQFGDLLKKHFTDSNSQELVYLERMQTAASRMSTLIHDLLSYSRIATHRELSTLVSLDMVVERVLNTLELVIAETGAEVQVDPLPTLLGDATQLGQLFQNLLSNALKFRRKEASDDWIRPLIEIRAQLVSSDTLPPSFKPARLSPAYHLIQVSDNGIGFEEKYLDRIFQVFQRLHGKNEFTGTGIGLAICEKVVANHGGLITATSQPGKGSHFSVYLPA
ncbi:PAS domain-containing protein [Fibrella sp. HMF5335]|uniref:histidine kinase n=1 Tax=Fibrella rubiginis TaxID=2817060 RepID=A0A939GFR6_9BACT|nr:PAS domain-containing protein [Fibrella rubiginis]MBO0936973.1 PAS domain-containing protein [Fibrella rubiginis]